MYTLLMQYACLVDGAVVGRCIMNVNEVMEVLNKIQNATEDLGLTPQQVANQISGLVNFNQVEYVIVE